MLAWAVVAVLLGRQRGTVGRLASLSGHAIARCPQRLNVHTTVGKPALPCPCMQEPDVAPEATPAPGTPCKARAGTRTPPGATESAVLDMHAPLLQRAGASPTPSEEKAAAKAAVKPTPRKRSRLAMIVAELPPGTSYLRGVRHPAAVKHEATPQYTPTPQSLHTDLPGARNASQPEAGAACAGVAVAEAAGGGRRASDPAAAGEAMQLGAGTPGPLQQQKGAQEREAALVIPRQPKCSSVTARASSPPASAITGTCRSSGSTAVGASQATQQREPGPQHPAAASVGGYVQAPAPTQTPPTNATAGNNPEAATAQGLQRDHTESQHGVSHHTAEPDVRFADVCMPCMRDDLPLLAPPPCRARSRAATDCKMRDAAAEPSRAEASASAAGGVSSPDVAVGPGEDVLTLGGGRGCSQLIAGIRGSSAGTAEAAARSAAVAAVPAAADSAVVGTLSGTSEKGTSSAVGGTQRSRKRDAKSVCGSLDETPFADSPALGERRPAGRCAAESGSQGDAGVGGKANASRASENDIKIRRRLRQAVGGGQDSLQPQPSCVDPGPQMSMGADLQPPPGTAASLVAVGTCPGDAGAARGQACDPEAAEGAATGEAAALEACTQVCEIKSAR